MTNRLADSRRPVPPASKAKSDPSATCTGKNTGDALRALVVAPSWIGDAIMAQPLFVRLHARFPGLQLDALAPRWVAPALERMPEITNVIDLPFRHGELALAGRYRLARQLARTGYQSAYVLPNSLKSALIPLLAGIPERIGFTGEARYGLINRRHTLDEIALPQMVERFAQLAEAPGNLLPRPVPYPRLTSSEEQQRATFRALRFCRPDKVAVFCPGAEYGPAKRWPAQHFAALANKLSRRGYSIWLLGSAKDKEIADEIVRRSSSAAAPRNLCGATSLAQAIDLIAAATFVVCNDSGLMHVAAALGQTVYAIFGSSSPIFTPPLSSTATVISLELPCSPCFKRECPYGHLDCLNKIDPQTVLDACLQPMRPLSPTELVP